MQSITVFLSHLLLMLAWGLVWSLGGTWLARVAFRLRENEGILVGVALGFILQNWLVNWLAWVIPLPWVSWLAAFIVLAAGGLLAWRLQGASGLRIALKVWPLVIFAGVLAVLYMVNRGLAIFDDFAHLPTVSIMAAGDFPPHFSFDPQVLYGYHHFLLLFSAQAMRVAGLTPWEAIDAGRALSLSLAVMLSALWVQRLTGSLVGGLLGGAMTAFGSGTRWLLLFIPHKVVLWLGRNIQMIGSGAGSGENLADALTRSWAVEGGGPVAFPFAFANGIFPPGVISMLTANGAVSFVVLNLLLLSCSRWRAGRWSIVAGALTAIVFSTWGLLTEAELVIFVGGWALVTFVYLVRQARLRRSLRLPASLWQWLVVIGMGTLLGFLEGGAWTDLIRKFILRVATGTAPASYQTVGFQAGAPAVVSSHLGALSLLEPGQALVALLECGPLLLVLPLLAVFGWKAFRLGRWYESASAATAFLALSMVFVQFTGSTGIRNTPRLYVFMPVSAVFAVPLVWWWAARRAQAARAVAAVLGGVTLMGGLLMFGIEAVAIQHPVDSYFLTRADIQMYQAHWNQLEPGSMVMDARPSRATTLFGRFTNAAYTWYSFKPEWTSLLDNPDPVALQKAGYGYIYLDESYWDRIGPRGQDRLQDSCVRLVDEVEEGSVFRRLLDVRDCR